MSAPVSRRDQGAKSPRQSLMWLWALVATLSLLVVWLLPRWTAIPDSLLATDIELPETPPERLVLRRAAFEELPGFADDPIGEALPALRRSCARFRFLGSARAVRPKERGGTVADWKPLCDPLLALGRDDTADRSDQVRRILRERAVPLQVLNNKREDRAFHWLL